MLSPQNLRSSEAEALCTDRRWLLSLRPLLRCAYTDNAGHRQDKENAIFWLVQVAQDFPGAFHQSIHQFFPFYHGEDGAMVVFLGAKEVAESGHQWRIVTKGDRKSTRLNSSHVKISYA